MYTIEAKSLLAKLLAEENVNVEYKNTSTASFNPETRTITIPNFQDGLSTQVINLFIGHEVSHALHTPTDEWMEILKTLPRSLVNIVEDVRIEKLIQAKYPGFKSAFTSAYNELFYLKDFFGVVDEDLNTLNLLDRINIYFKVGSATLIEFSDEEQYFTNKIANTKTFDDVIEVSKELYNYLKELPKDEAKKDSADDEYQDDLDLDFADDFESVTQDNFDNNLGDYISTDNHAFRYIDINIPDSKHYIITTKELLDDINSIPGMYNIELSQYSKFISENRTIIQQYISEFILQKNANGMKKCRHSTSGDLDIDKIFKYEVSDDLFKVSVIKDREQSHGLVFFLDWSMSMSGMIHKTIKQLITLLIFCQKLKIPYSVYAFSDGYGVLPERRYYQPKIPCSTIINSQQLQLLNLFNHKMSSKDFKTMANFLLGYTESRLYNRYLSAYRNADGLYTDIPLRWQLNGTPLDDTLIVAMDIIPKFKSTNKVDKVHSIFLTDGCTSKEMSVVSLSAMVANRLDGLVYNRHSSSTILREPKTKMQVTLPKISPSILATYGKVWATIGLYELLRKYVDDNIISYRIISSKELKKVGYFFSNDLLPKEKVAEIRKQFKAEKYISINDKIVDKAFLMMDNSLEMEDDDYELTDNMSVKAMTKIFSKVRSSKSTSRMFLQEFIKMIS